MLSMATWLLKADNDPLAAIRRFLRDIWSNVDLEGMLIPISQTDHKTIETALLNSPDRLADADPMVPLMQSNAGKLVARLARGRPNGRFAAVLRACEVRALNELVKRSSLS